MNINEAQEDLKQRAAGVQDELKRRAAGLQSDASEALGRADSYARENPVPTILGALAIGFLIGVLVRPSEPTPRSRWEDAKDAARNRASDAEDTLHDLLNAIAKKSRKAYKKSSSAIRDAVEQAAEAVGDIDVDDYADPVSNWFRKLWKRAK